MWKSGWYFKQYFLKIISNVEILKIPMLISIKISKSKSVTAQEM